MPMPKTMSAMVLTGHGGPEKLVYYNDFPVPQPGAHDVLIEVSACGLNNTDIKVREAQYAVDFDPNSDLDETSAAASIAATNGETGLSFPRIQGADIVGRIAAVGDKVPQNRLGERVLVDFSIYHAKDTDGSPRMDLSNVDYIGHGADGGFADYVVVPALNAHKIQRNIPDAELATFGCATLTAEHMLSRVSAKSGDKILITGAGGGVGSAAIQLARARGAIPYAVTSRGKEEQILSLGAEACICRQDFTDQSGGFDKDAFLVAVTEATRSNRSVDVVIDQVGGSMFHGLLQALRPDGHYISAGTISGYTPRINLHTVYMAFLNIHGSSQGQPEDFARIVDYIEAGKIGPTLGGIFPLSQLHHAQKTFQAKNYVGNIVVVPDAKWKEFGEPDARR